MLPSTVKGVQSDQADVCVLRLGAHRHEIDLVGVLTVWVKPHLTIETTFIGKRESWWKSDQHRHLHKPAETGSAGT